MNIACSTATSLSPLMEKVSFYCNFVFREPRKVYKVKKVRKTVLGLRVSNSTLEDLEDLSVKCMCRLLSFSLPVELFQLEFHPGPHLKSAKAGERLGTRQ